jgi:TonB family protein
MTTQWSSAFLLSALLHGLIAVSAVVLGLAVAEQVRIEPRPLQLVAASGQPMASWLRSAHAADAPASVRFTAPPKPAVAPPTPESTEADDGATEPRATVLPVHPPGAATAPSGRPRPAAAPAKPPKSASPRTATTSVSAVAPVPHLDGQSIASALRGAAAEEQGRAANASDGTDARYQTLLESTLAEALERVPGLEDELRAEAEFQLLPSGHATGARLTRRSGSDRFDAAILGAIRDLALPPPPQGFPLTQRLPFHTRAR